MILSLAIVFSAGLGAAQEKLRIGLVIEQTGAGASLGAYWIKAFELAVGEINKGGGVLGRQVEYEVFDNQSKAPVSVSATQKALSWGAFAIAGPIYSGNTLACMPVAQEAKTPQMTGSENWRITLQGNKYIWRMSTGQTLEIQKLLNWVMTERKPKALGMLYVNNDFGIGGLETAKKLLKEKYNTDLVMAAACEQKQPDYSAELKKIKESNADVVLLNLLEEESAMFYRHAKKVGLNVFLCAVNTGISVDACRLGKEAVDGVYGTSGYEYSAPEPGCQRLAKYYRERYGEWPDNEFMKGYNAVYLVKTGIELAKSFDKEKFVEKMHNVHITPKIQPNIVGGSLYYDENGELHSWDYLAKVTWDGKEALAKALFAIPPFKGPDSDKKTVVIK